MKKLLIWLVSGLLLTGLLTACQGNGNEEPTAAPHKHTFATEWSMDENGHWYAANCGHEMQANVATHTDDDNDGVCDICGWDGDHEHVFAEEWSHDETNHWYAATCRHAVKKDEAPHADTNNDGVCDGCAWNYDHEHTYAKEWSHDNDNHFHAVTCGHDVEAKGKAAHEDADNNGICDGCAWDYDHTHEYAEAWSHDADNHWKDTSCGHAVVSEQAPHTDENNDGICDGCAWNYDHEHTYQADAEWTINDTHHWHAPTCGHDVEGIDQTEHADADDNKECDVCGYDYNHEHEYDTSVWKWDKKAHYHEATCGHAVRADEEDHKDADNNGICDVCEWNYDHTHEFSEEWTHDKNGHWHAPTCSHSVKSGEEAHVDANNDKCCDVCAWDYDHTHTFNTSAWSIGTDTHYYLPSCGCNPQYVRGEEVKHEDKNRDDKCDTCGGFVSLEVVVDNATSDEATAHVKNGIIDMTYGSSGYTGKVYYEFGDGYLHMTDSQQYSGTNNSFEYWYGIYDTNSILAIAQEGDEPYRNMGAESVFMDGYYFSGEFISYAFTCYGVEDLVYQLYGLPISADSAASCTNYSEFYDQTANTYSFSYFYGTLYVQVTFKVNADFVMTDIEIITGSSAANATHVINVKQTVGVRDAVNPYDPDQVLISSYTIVDKNGNEVKDGDVIDMVTGANYKVNLSVKDLLPATADPAFDRISIQCNDPDAMYTFASSTGDMIINGRKEGTYTVSFVTDRTVKTITVNITYPAPTFIKGQIFELDGSYKTYSEYTMYLGQVLNFNASVNENADNRYTAVILRNSQNGTLSESVIEVLRQQITVTTFTPNELGDYLIQITSVADPSVYGMLVVHVVEPVKIENILTGHWKANFYGSIMWEADFTPESEGATKGTVKIVDKTKTVNGNTELITTAVFAYEYKTDGLQLTWIEGDEMSVSITITEDYNLKIGNFTLKRTN
ncbi:MAG: hypothetical protein IJW00_08545 [Clostridia bacterium]|nr:hypothetical protein [Clostridia bacterium]